MNKPYVSHEEATIESFQLDPDYAAEYLNAVLEDGDQEELMLALRRVAAATGLNENTLHRTLSAKGNPKLSTLSGICKAVGMEISITQSRSSAYTVNLNH